MSKIDRRTALSIGAVTPLGWTLPIGGEIDTTTQGINIKLFWDNGWHVMVPDFKNRSSYWRPGMSLQWVNIPIEEYLKELEDYFELKQRA